VSADLSGKTAIITGGSQGIGLGVARRLVADGATVVITGRTRDTLDAAVDDLGGPDKALAVQGPADDQAHQAETVARAVDTFGSADFLVNNAGGKPPWGPMTTLDLGAARELIETNVLAALSWIQHIHRGWMQKHGGSIVNVSSIGARLTTPGIGLYGATKAMLEHLTQELAMELAPAIRVNAVAPGVVKTAFAAVLYEGREAEVSATYPLARLGEPADIGSAVAYLLSPESQWVTGQVLVIDGGYTLGGGASRVDGA
jgi:NAD(P)-dependent dehydrogenase (short-subunit alcohol dehydrogenase family)